MGESGQQAKPGGAVLTKRVPARRDSAGSTHSLGSRVRAKLADYKPTIGSAYLTYMDLDATDPPGVEVDPSYSHALIESSDHPLFHSFATPSMRKVAAPRVDAGDWYAIVILVDDEVVGHAWFATRSERGLFSGVMNVRLRPEEAYGFDLFIKPEHRRGSLGSYMADIGIPDLKRRGFRYGYTHLLYENIPSMFWHHTTGFNLLQTYNYLRIGPRILWKVPFSETPRYGPISRRGRHNDPERKEPFGGSLFPTA